MTRCFLVLALTSPLLFGCELWDAPLSDPDCGSTAVDVEAELLITEPWLRKAERAKNANGAVLSFAGQWAALGQRYPGFDGQALWSLLGVDASLPTAELPFRLLAVVNRTDLAEQLAPESPAGEARLVYTLTNGPGDDPASAALPLTLIFEYSLGEARTARAWSAAFHALGDLKDTRTLDRVRATQALVESFVSPAAHAGSPHLSQLRVNDARFGSGELYELALDDAGKLRRRGLRNTPRRELAQTPELLAFALDQQSAIEDGTHRVPATWLATSARVEPVTWLGAASSLERDFARSTCPGCHGPDGPGEQGFHLAEGGDGSVELSPFLTNEDLPRRAQLLRARLCEH